MVKPDKSRYIYLYTDSKEEKARYEELAKKTGAPLSKFLLNVIHEGLTKESDETPRIKLLEENSAIKEQNKRLTEELKLKSIVLDRYEEDLKRYRSAAFAEDSFLGKRQYNTDLIRVIKQGPIHDYRLLEALGIDLKDQDQMKAITRQLEALETYGLIAKGPNGWRWIG